ncbi:hypothetical protein BpHYR1_038404 [Brachionus plicatilis]|uniref:Uncharacterized protein n=1 Tax=Brachionus plicatilis TaxID=10195 RepID=A0A3M7PID6_BRAPC|nr:hypothetical protein BpHYR1_038404 [Brachionus plicatilis]
MNYLVYNQLFPLTNYKKILMASRVPEYVSDD